MPPIAAKVYPAHFTFAGNLLGIAVSLARNGKIFA